MNRHPWNAQLKCSVRKYFSSAIVLVAASGWLALPAICRAQNAPLAPNAVVRANSLAVHSEARQSSDVVATLKKGDALVLGLELKNGPEKWCSVSLPGQVRLSYVACDGLERSDRRSGDIAMPANAVPAAEELNAGSVVKTRPAVRVPFVAAPAEKTGDYSQVAASVVHDELLDGSKITEYEQAARGGAAAAMTRAAYAHIAAADFELEHSDSGEALEHYREALSYVAKQPQISFVILLGTANVHLVRSEYSEALDYLVQARKISPNSAAVAQLSGWAYYGLSQLDDAIREWKTAQRLAPSPAIAELLEKAERDKEVESGSRESGSSHFALHYQGSATPQLANDILRTLEDDYRSLQNDLHFAPPESIGVILYTQQSFRDITRAPSWSGAINDGRIRVPVQGLDSVTDDLSRVLKHELTHSFVRQMTLGRCPTWLNEGLAQWEEGRRSANYSQALVAAYDKGSFLSLKRLEGPWNSFSAATAAYAYAWSLAAVESVMARSGAFAITRLLSDLSTGSLPEDALREALQTNYADFDRQTAEYLRATYK